MSFVVKRNSIDYSIIQNPLTANSDSGDTSMASEKHGITYGVSEAGEKKYMFSEARAIILLEMVRGLKWRPPHAAEEIMNCPAGMAFIVPAETECALVWPKSAAHIVITLDDLASSASERDGQAGQALMPVCFPNRQCLQLAQILWTELRVSSHIGEGYLNAFRKVLTGVLIRNAAIARASGRQQFGLSNYACRQIENYLKENFRNSVSVPDMAALVVISAGHFATCFRASFGLTPHQYLMRLRLDEVERCLRETDIALSEIAASVGFSSQSHMTTALRKYRHLTPGEVRRRSYAQRQRRKH